MAGKLSFLGYVCGMSTEDTIRIRLAQPDGIEFIDACLSAKGKLRRKLLAKQLCDEFNLVNSQGARLVSECLKALRALEKEGVIVLPPNNKRLWREVEPPVGVPSRVDGITELTLVSADEGELKKVWTELMIREHPLEAGWTAGRTLRYLLQSEHGILGAVCFGPSALNLAAREQWVGWNREQKSMHLQRIACMTRFLIRPMVDCRNLASRALSMAVARVRSDFEQRFGCRPWLLETFVDPTYHDGACYRAANWVNIGETCGRGRQDRFKRADKGVKAVYMYVLEPQFRTLMGLDREAGDVPLSPRAEADFSDWARREFGEAELGDKRITDRLVKIAERKGARPGQSNARIFDNDWTETMGYYRFVEHPNVEAINMESILKPHRQRTIRRMKACGTVLCIQDTTDLNYSSNSNCEGLGVIGKNQTSTESRGLRLHSTLVTDDAGIPLGVLRTDCYARELKPEHRGKDARHIPVEQKETYRWIEGHLDIADTASRMHGVRVISIADREGDFYDLFHSHQAGPGAELLIRAKHDRATDDQLKMFEAVQRTPVQGTMRIHIEPRSGRPKKGKTPERPCRRRRDADVVVRHMPISIRPPGHGVSSGSPPVQATLIHVCEPNPPAETEDPVNWFLLTTADIDSFEDAAECVKYYCTRWRVEDWHRVLKSACRVEDTRLKTADRLKRDIAVNMVIAWRIMLMALLGRELPELPPDILFSELEIDTLRSYAKKKD